MSWLKNIQIVEDTENKAKYKEFEIENDKSHVEMDFETIPCLS